jgi:RHS repeat-associated protein
LAAKCNVGGTPTIFINGLKLADRSLDGYHNRIDSLLASEGKTISRARERNGVRYILCINDVSLRLVQVLMETDNAGIIGASYTYGQGLISMDRAGADSYYHYDGLGSARQLTDSAGVLAASYTYDSYGNLIASSGTAANTYGFTGEQQFGEADNLVFLRARYYKPSIGRFISRDPIGYGDGMNVYEYVKNNPVRYTDASGLECNGKKNVLGQYPPQTNSLNCMMCCDKNYDEFKKELPPFCWKDVIKRIIDTWGAKKKLEACHIGCETANKNGEYIPIWPKW